MSEPNRIDRLLQDAYEIAMKESSETLAKVPTSVMLNLLDKCADVNDGMTVAQFRDALSEEEMSVLVFAALPTLGTVLHLRAKEWEP